MAFNWKTFRTRTLTAIIFAAVMLAGLLWSERVQDALWLGVYRIGPMALHPLALLYVVSGSAMISTIRIPKP